MRHTLICALVACVASGVATVQEERDVPEQEVVIAGSRLPASLDTFPGSVTIVDEATIATQRELSSDLGDLLAITVPSLGTSSFMGSNRDQSLRGRKPVVLIDGVPISTPLRDGDAEVRSIDSGVLQSIEVIHGSTSLYGNGGAGGTINYITRRPEPGEFAARVEGSVSGSLTHFSDSDNLGIRASFSGGANRISYILAAGYEDVGYQFDADGDRIPPTNGGTISGLASSEVKSGFGKLSFGIDDDRRIEASINYYEQYQETPYTLVAGNIATGIKATTANTGRDPRQILVPGNESIVFTGTYVDEAVFGGALTAQAYYLDYENTYGLSPAFPSVAQPSQSINKNRKNGARVDFDTPVGESLRLLWGFDYANDKTRQPLADGRTWTPLMDLTSLAAFVQADTDVGDRWTVRGGVRYEENELEVDTFTTFRNVTAQGGTLDFNATTFNLGATFSATDAIDLFAGYSEGSSVGEIGRVLRDIRANTSVSTVDPRAVIVETYEIGVRGKYALFDFEVVGFRNESEFGIQLQQDPANPLLTIATQEDEKIEGAELSMGFEPSDPWRMTVTAAWQDGERDANRDGTVDTNLDNVRIAPLKVTAGVDFAPTARWNVRVQGLHSGSRDPFPGATGNNVLNLGRNESFTVFDVLGSLQVGPGRLSLAVLNVFNEEYFPRWAQSQNRNDRYSAAPGTNAKLTYAVSF
ncbi:MAG: TonB-dependent receptor, partial [Steroidobacteraceae bacterium]